MLTAANSPSSAVPHRSGNRLHLYRCSLTRHFNQHVPLGSSAGRRPSGRHPMRHAVDQSAGHQRCLGCNAGYRLLAVSPKPSDGPWVHALGLAESALRLSNPNPRVGCVITTADGGVLGQGHTQQAGGPHAEVMALRDAQARDNSVQGATAHVTLEPCSHHGRTPPCCDALIAAGIARVVDRHAGPEPQGGGARCGALARGGHRGGGSAARQRPARASRELNIGFFSRMIRWHALGADEDGGVA